MSAIGVFAFGVLGQNDNGPDIFIHHHRTQSGPPGLLGSEKPPGPVDRFGGIIVMAVDAAIVRFGGPDAGGKENHILFGITLAYESGRRSVFFQFKYLIKSRRLGQVNLHF